MYLPFQPCLIRWIRIQIRWNNIVVVLLPRKTKSIMITCPMLSHNFTLKKDGLNELRNQNQFAKDKRKGICIFFQQNNLNSGGCGLKDVRLRV